MQEKMIKKFKDYLTEQDKKFIKETVLGPNFSYYLNDHTVKTDSIVDAKNYFFSHTIILRPELRNPDFPYNSEHFEYFVKLISRVVKKIDINLKEIYRMSLNLTFSNGIDGCPEHQDHDYKHKTIILYLNECDEEASTFIVDENKTHEIKPTFNTGVYFGSNIHSMKNPKHGLRLVLVTTFI